MKKNSRIILFGALTFMLLLTACAAEEGTPAPWARSRAST